MTGVALRSHCGGGRGCSALAMIVGAGSGKQRAWVFGRLGSFEGMAEAKAEAKAEAEAEAPLIRPLGTFSRKREKGDFTLF